MRMRRQSGYTIAEILVVIAIIGVLVAAAIPAFSSYRIINKMKTSSRNLIADMRTARGLAVTHSHQVKLTYQPGTSSYDYWEGNRTTGSTAWTRLTGPGSNPSRPTRTLDPIAYFPKSSTLQTFDPDPDSTNLPNNLAVIFSPDGSVTLPASASTQNPPAGIVTIQTNLKTTKQQYQFWVTAGGRVLVK